MVLLFTTLIFFILISSYYVYIKQRLYREKIIYTSILFSQSVELDRLYRRSNFLMSFYEKEKIEEINEKFNYKERSSCSSRLYYLIYEKYRSFSGDFKILKKINNKEKILLFRDLYIAQEKEIEVLFNRELYLINNCKESLLESPYQNGCNYINSYYSTCDAVRKAFIFDENNDDNRLFNIKSETMDEYLKLTSLYYSKL